MHPATQSDAAIDAAVMQAPGMERNVLGIFLSQPGPAKAIGLPLLCPDDFAGPKARTIFNAIRGVVESGAEADTHAVTHLLHKAGHLAVVGGPHTLAELAIKAPGITNLEQYCRILNEYRVRRQLFGMAHGILKSLREDADVFDLLSNSEATHEAIQTSFTRTALTTLKTVASDAFSYLADRHQNPTAARVQFGIPPLDRLVGGLEPGDAVVIGGRPGMAKCHGAETRILLFDGSIKRADCIQAGDVLMGDDNTPRTVLTVATGREQMYWVRQNNADDYRVNASHILSLKQSRNEGSSVHGTVKNIAVGDWLGLSAKQRNNLKGYKVAAEFAPQPLPLDPYFFGLWLGDGRSNGSPICNPEPEIIAWLHLFAERNGWKVTPHHYRDRCPSWNVCGVAGAHQPGPQAVLREMGVLNNKHIPEAYFCNSRANRLRLLAGLVDTDGHRASSGTYQISSVLPGLADDIKRLCDGLGFRTSITAKKAVITSIGYETIAYYVNFNGDTSELPCLVPRKQGQPWTSPIDYHMTGVRLEADEVDDYYGFTLDSNHLYCLADGTVTHNTDCIVHIIRHNALVNGLPGALFSLEMTKIQMGFRFLSDPSGVPANAMRGVVDSGQVYAVAKAVESLTNAELVYLDDQPNHTVSSIRAFVKQAKAHLAQRGKQLYWVAVDYLQLAKGSGSGTKADDLDEVSRGLKVLAKEEGVVMFELAQLSRAVESRSPPVPIISDLRASGQIEQDADLIVFPYRPSYYGLLTDSEGAPVPGPDFCEFIAAKNRNNAPGRCAARYLPHRSRFVSYDEPAAEAYVAPGRSYSANQLPASDFDTDEPGF